MAGAIRRFMARFLSYAAIAAGLGGGAANTSPATERAQRIRSTAVSG